MIGTHIGPYELLGKVGEGGMGQVYRARDARLNRDVAIKVLPDTFVRDDERLARFTRESRVLASLDHSNIARVYGVEFPSPNLPALVMEFVDGDDLAERIAGGRMPLPEALAIARQIAEALEAAHEQGIVHRDLKPANVKVRRDGTVKVLDFGLAKVAEAPVVGGMDAMAHATVTSPAMTHAGVLLGTAAYMAPEQARGKAVDKRADIWSFGALLYELVTGTQAFDGQSVSDVLAAVVRHEIDWSRLPADTPPALRQLLVRCLEPDVRQRLRDIGEARVAIAGLEGGRVDTAAGASTDPSSHRRWREYVAWSLAAAALVGAAAIGLWSLTSRRDSASFVAAATRLSVPPPTGFLINPDSTNVAISPNGRMLAFIVGTGVSTENQLWVRALESSEPRRIESGDGVALPFWSPDSGSIGFFAGGKLKIVPAAGGTAQVLSNTPFARGGTWNSSNTILFAPDAAGPLFRVSAAGGAVTPVNTLDATRKETGHRFPFFLPDGDHFLYAALPGTDGMFDIFAGRLSEPNTRTLIGSMESAPVYAPGTAGSERGWLLFTRQGVLVAQPFDAATLKLTGDAVTLGDQPAVAPGPAAYEAGRRISASTTGALAYYLAPDGNVSVQWMDLAGKTSAPLDVPSGRYTGVAIAPDASKAVLVRSASPTSSELWIADLTRPSAIPLATGTRLPSPIWSPDSTRIIFSSQSSGRSGLSEKSVMAGASERQVFRSDSAVIAQDWSTDLGIVINRIDPGTKWNIYRLGALDAAAPQPLVTGPSIEAGGRLSPNQRWLAYLSDEAGRLDLYLQSVPAGQKAQVAAAVQQYWWTPDGKAILYTTRARTLWRVDVDLRGPAPRIAPPIQLASLPSTLVYMDLAPDGRRFLALVPERTGVGTVAIVQSWRAAVTSNR